MSKIFRTLLVVLPALVLASGCASDKEKNCPAASAIVDTAIATVFKNSASTDPTNILYTVEVTGVRSHCDVDKQAVNSISSVDISFRATRAPNGAAAEYKVPYFIVVSQEERLLAKRIYMADFSFEPGQTTATFTQSAESIDVSAGKEKKTYDYNILVGLQLTKEQLDYNRASGRLDP